MKNETNELSDYETSEANMIHRGFDCGNYAHAYISEDFETALESAQAEDHNADRKDNPAWIGGFVLGFFGCLEDSDLCSEDFERVSEARGEWMAKAIALGIAVNEGDCPNFEAGVSCDCDFCVDHREDT